MCLPVVDAEVVAEVAIEAEADDGGDAVTFVLVEGGGDVVSGVGGGGGFGVVEEDAYVGVGADEAGDDGLAGAVDDGGVVQDDELLGGGEGWSEDHREEEERSHECSCGLVEVWTAFGLERLDEAAHEFYS